MSTQLSQNSLLAIAKAVLPLVQNGTAFEDPNSVPECKGEHGHRWEIRTPYKVTEKQGNTTVTTEYPVAIVCSICKEFVRFN